MHFADPRRKSVLDLWRADTSPSECAMGDNVWFEERVSPARWRHFEALAPDLPSPESLAAWQKDYCATYVRNDNPDTFRADLDPARLVPGLLDTHQRIIRLESIPSASLNEAGLTFGGLTRAFTGGDDAVLDVFLQNWNARRDGRPAFAAWKDELRAELQHADWADRIRDRLGLAHYDPGPNPIPVMLVEYDVASVVGAASRGGVRDAFACPTVIDSQPSPWFFPSPAGLAYGRTVNLRSGAPSLLAEFLHLRITYTRAHIARLGEIRRPVDNAVDMRDMRNRHLATLRTESHRPDFGEDMR